MAENRTQNEGTAGKRIVVCATGASGARLLARFLHHLLLHPKVLAVHFIPSAPFELVLQEEDMTLDSLLHRLPERQKLAIHGEMDLGAPVSSGSFPVDATVIVPASMATVGHLASGAGRTLIHRCGDVALKEGRPLIIVPRETPFSLVHLRNLTTLKEAGAEIMPFNPAFYQLPKTIDELVDHFLMRVLDHLGLETDIAPRWG